jgi:tetratricopeptide (TPR) repeat protein
MDEQRLRAYVGLIEQLLDCPHGQEADLLQTNAELVDAGLLAVIDQVATHLESKENSNANWLRRFAAQLAQALEIKPKEKTAKSTANWLRKLAVQLAQVLEIKPGQETTKLTAVWLGRFAAQLLAQALGIESMPKTAKLNVKEDAVKFLLEALQLVAENQGNPQQIYSVWAQQQAQFDSTLLEILPQVVAQLFERDAEQRAFLAAVLSKFGNLIQQFPLGTRLLNLELGIAAYEQSLPVYTRSDFPEKWAMTQHSLAKAYASRIQGDRADNLERAIAAYEQALQIYTHDTFPELWAMTQHNLANTYANRIRGNHADNIEKAIVTCKSALQVYARAASPEEWAETQTTLAKAYAERIRGDRAENIERAIAAYEQALTVKVREAFPIEWATTMMGLATAYCNRMTGYRADNLERAIASCESTLQIYTREAFPVEWAKVQIILAKSYSERIRGDRADNLEQAILACESALQVYSRETSPEKWAETQSILARVYSEGVRRNHVEHTELAISARKSALQIYTRDAFPENWAREQLGLAEIYFDSIHGDRLENTEKAINAYMEAAQGFRQLGLAEDLSRTLHNLGLACSGQARNRIEPDQNREREKSIAAYTEAAQISRQLGSYRSLSITLNNLGCVYRDMQRFEEAIHSWNESLNICQEQGDSLNAFDALSYLGNTYRDIDDYQQSFQYLQEALNIAQNVGGTYHQFKALNNLGATYTCLNDYQQALNCYQEALGVAQTSGDHNDRSLTLVSLADLSQALGNHQECISFYEEALAISQQIFDRELEVSIQTKLTQVLLRVENFERAIEVAQSIPDQDKRLKVLTGVVDEVRRVNPRPTRRQSILFLAANPANAERLRYDQEMREIGASLQRIQSRSQFTLEKRLASRPRDMQRALLEVRPQIIHFLGGTNQEGLSLEDDDGTIKLVDSNVLSSLFELFADQIHCVVMSGCYSVLQAQVISQYIPYVIGISQAIGDEDVISFTVAFYDAVGAGRDIEFAYKLGCVSVQLAGIDGPLMPVLLKQTAQSNSDSLSEKRLKVPFVLPQIDITPFTGYEFELNHLEELLVSNRSSKNSRIVMLTGMGGSGKSALAYHFATIHRDEFLDGVIGLGLNGKDLHTIAREFARYCGEEIDPEDERDAKTLMQDIFAHRRMLLIFDNVDRSELKDLLPGGQHCAVIVITRDRAIAASFGLFNDGIIDLSRLSKDLAKQLLAKILGTERLEAEKDATDQIIEMMGGLPLALQIAGSTLQGRKRSLSSYVESLQEETNRLQRLQVRGDSDLNLMSSLHLSLALLDDSEKDFLARLSVCAEDEFSLQEAMISSGLIDEFEAQDCLDRLYQLSLLNRPEIDRFTFHPIIKIFAKNLAYERGLWNVASERYSQWKREVEGRSINVVYDLLMSISTDTISVGQELEVAITLNSLNSSCNGITYLLEIPRNEVSGNELIAIPNLVRYELNYQLDFI